MLSGAYQTHQAEIPRIEIAQIENHQAGIDLANLIRTLLHDRLG